MSIFKPLENAYIVAILGISLSIKYAAKRCIAKIT